MHLTSFIVKLLEIKHYLDFFQPFLHYNKISVFFLNVYINVGK